MVIALAIVLALTSLLVVAIPMLRARQVRQGTDPLEAIDELWSNRQSIYGEMIALKKELEIGNLSKMEFEAVFQNLRRRAAESLHVETLWRERLKDLDDALEREILEVKKRRAAHGRRVICQECDAVFPALAERCPSCGTEAPVLAETHPGGKRG